MPLKAVLSTMTWLPVLLAPLGAHAQTRPARETAQIGLIDRTFFPQPIMVAIQNGLDRPPFFRSL